jgi:hypothetical protein
MLRVALGTAVIGVTAVVTGIVTGIPSIAWFGAGAGAFGLMLMIVNARLERQRRDAESAAAAPTRRYNARHSDYGPSDRPAPDALIHDNHDVERGLAREEHSQHHDTGPRERDISKYLAFEEINRSHMRASKDRGKRS